MRSFEPCAAMAFGVSAAPPRSAWARSGAARPAFPVGARRRPMATRALGRLGILNDRIEARLVELLSDPWFRARGAAATALVKLKSKRAAVEITRALEREVLDFGRSTLEQALADLRKSK